ncbi:MAG: DUF1800 domain-containing protein [Ferruginibacter sp.]
MDRKSFFTNAKKNLFATKPEVFSNQRGLTSGINPYTGTWTINEAAHLLKRTMFGAKKSDIDHLLTLTKDQAVDELLNNISVPNPPLRDYGLIDEEGTLYDDLGVALGQTWVNDPNTASADIVKGSINRLRMESLRKWWAGLIIKQERSIQEKMVLFWHHHYSVQQEEVGDSAFLYRHHSLLRTNVLGNVKTLAKAVTIDPAMLLHLNGYLNSRQAPDENYAREFQELFTIGKGTDSGFTENDVIAAARVLTGWRVKSNPVGSFMDPSAHDTGSKTFSSFYNNTVITGSTNPTQELDTFVDMIFATTEASKFICRKIYKWFVYYNIDDNTELNVITPLATILRNNNYEIKPVLSALFKSEHFFDTLNQACYIKSPFDILAGTLREFDINFPPYTDYLNGYPLFESLFENAAAMQQELFQPPDVSGYAAYVQDPMNYELWVNSNSLPRRADFTDGLINDRMIDVKAFASYSGNPADPNQLIADITALLLRYPLSVNSKNYIKTKFLLNNTTDDTIWTNAWNSNNNVVITASLNEMFRFIMNLPEFHLC